MAVAKETNPPYSSQEYKLEWGYEYKFQAELQAVKYLENKGYTNVYGRPTDSEISGLKSGYFVVVKTEYLVDGKAKISYGLGASAISYEEAEAYAVENLGTYDWSWGKAKGYTIDRKGMYDDTPQYQLVYVIKTIETACGKNSEFILAIQGPIKSTSYQGIYKSYIKKNEELGENIYSTKHIIKNSGYVGVLKCIERCSDNSFISKYKIVEASNAEEINAMAPHMTGIAGDAGDDLYFVENIYDMSVSGENASMFQEAIDILNKFITNPEDKENLKRWVGIGVRG